MKKIVFVIESLHCGGAEKSLVTLLNLIDYNEFNVDLVLFKKGGEFEKFVPPNIKIVYVKPEKNNNLVYKTYQRSIFWFIKKLKTHIFLHHAQIHWSVFKKSYHNYKENYDIAIAYNQGFSTYYVANKISAKKKYAWLNTDYKKAGYNINFDYKHYNHFDKIVCVSKESEISIQKEAKKINNNISTLIIKDISDIKMIKKMSLESKGLIKQKNIIRLLTIGRLAKAKGYHLAIESCKILLKKGYNINWFVIGDGPEHNKLQKLISVNNLENNFIILGYKENPYPYVKTCDIYVQTSLFEGLGLTVIEASILQKPIVTTNFPTASSIITNEETGLICEMNAIDISESIERYINNIDLKEKVIGNLLLAKNNDKEVSLKKVNELLNV